MSKNIGIPKGTRDFSPSVLKKRKHIFNTIQEVFQLYGFEEIETPTMENLSTLTGKYGDEGDRLLFKVLNSGNFIKGSKTEDLFDAEMQKLDIGRLPEEKRKAVNQLAKQYCEKGLRYDLTVPFARFVVQNQNDLSFPFKRYQIQPVWRADRPQRGRYREFYQCDVDIIGSDSLIHEVDLVKIYDEALTRLGLQNFTIKINNRKILAGLVEYVKEEDNFTAITVAIDKLDKIGNDGVKKELIEKGISETSADTILNALELEGSNLDRLDKIVATVGSTEIGAKGIEELKLVLELLGTLEIKTANIEFDMKLARGLNYYTGAIFEVAVHDVQIGSIGGGGRYDDLTGNFGLKGMSGVGVSFGADRIFDVMEELELFKELTTTSSEVLLVSFNDATLHYALTQAQSLRENGIRCEVYPSPVKLKKQMKYANDKQIPFAILIGDDEMASGKLGLKNLENGEQESLSMEEIIEKIKAY